MMTNVTLIHHPTRFDPKAARYTLERVPAAGEYVINRETWHEVIAVATDLPTGRVFLLIDRQPMAT